MKKKCHLKVKTTIKWQVYGRRSMIQSLSFTLAKTLPTVRPRRCWLMFFFFLLQGIAHYVSQTQCLIFPFWFFLLFFVFIPCLLAIALCGNTFGCILGHAID